MRIFKRLILGAVILITVAAVVVVAILGNVGPQSLQDWISKSASIVAPLSMLFLLAVTIL